MSDTVARRPGRPRDPQADAAILEAATELLSEVGFGGFTVDAVASRAGVGKATIYRRWPSREALIVDAAATAIAQPDVPDTGTLRGDLVDLFTQVFASKREHLHKESFMTAVMAEAAVNPEMKRVLGEYTANRREVSTEVLARAIARGEIGADVDTRLLSDVIVGTLMYRMMLTNDPLDGELVAQVVDVALRAFGARPAS